MVCMSSPCFLSFLRFFWIRPTTKLHPSSPSSGLSSSSCRFITNWGFIQKVSVDQMSELTDWETGKAAGVFMASDRTYKGGSCSLRQWNLFSRCHQIYWRSNVWQSRLEWCRGSECTILYENNGVRSRWRTSCRDGTRRSFTLKIQKETSKTIGRLHYQNSPSSALAWGQSPCM